MLQAFVDAIETRWGVRQFDRSPEAVTLNVLALVYSSCLSEAIETLSDAEYGYYDASGYPWDR